MAKTVAQLTTQLTPYLAISNTLSAGETLIGMLNITLPRIYQLGDWKALRYEYQADVSAGYFCLPMDSESVLQANIEGIPVSIHDSSFEYQKRGPGQMDRPVSSLWGIIDRGFLALMSELPDGGADEFIFTSIAPFASGDYAKITYLDSLEGFTEVNLPLFSTATSVTGAATYADDLETLLTVTSSTGFVVNAQVTITSASAGDEDYEETWRVSAVPDGTHIAIVKEWDGDAAVTATITSNPTLRPENSIGSVDSLEFTSLPARTMMKDADGIIYAILPPGDGISQFRRYDVPQVPESTEDEFLMTCVVKRAFTPITSTSQAVLIDNIPALKAAFQAVSYEDNGDFQRSEQYWDRCRAILDGQLFDTKGGVEQLPQVSIWGTGVAGLPAYH